MNLFLPLKTKWFNMTKDGVKKEDYREINEYWCKRLLNYDFDDYQCFLEMIDDLSNPNRRYDSVEQCMKEFNTTFRQFDYNVLSLGYPKSDQSHKFLHYKHDGIEIRTGNSEWGAEPNKLYFVIKHEI